MNNGLTQIILVIGLLCITCALLFVTVPAENKEVFQTCLTAIISFISGAAFGFGYRRKDDKGSSGSGSDDKPVE